MCSKRNNSVVDPSRIIVFNNTSVLAFKKGYYYEAFYMIQGAIQTLCLYSISRKTQNSQANTADLNVVTASKQDQKIKRANEALRRFNSNECRSTPPATNNDARISCNTFDISAFMYTEAMKISFHFVTEGPDPAIDNEDDKMTLAACTTLYNLALIYHKIGIQDNSICMINKAIDQYKSAYQLLLSRGDILVSTAFSESNGNDEECVFLTCRLAMAILNNMGQIYYDILNDYDNASMLFESLIELAVNANASKECNGNTDKESTGLKGHPSSLISTLRNEQRAFIINAYVFKRQPHASAA